MNLSRLFAHVAAATAGSTVWLIAINMPGAEPTPVLKVVAILPWLVAALSYLVAQHVTALESRKHRCAPATYSPRAQDAIGSPKRRELVR